LVLPHLSRFYLLLALHFGLPAVRRLQFPITAYRSVHHGSLLPPFPTTLDCHHLRSCCRLPHGYFTATTTAQLLLTVTGLPRFTVTPFARFGYLRLPVYVYVTTGCLRTQFTTVLLPVHRFVGWFWFYVLHSSLVPHLPCRSISCYHTGYTHCTQFTYAVCGSSILHGYTVTTVLLHVLQFVAPFYLVTFTTLRFTGFPVLRLRYGPITVDWFCGYVLVTLPHYIRIIPTVLVTTFLVPFTDSGLRLQFTDYPACLPLDCVLPAAHGFCLLPPFYCGCYTFVSGYRLDTRFRYRLYTTLPHWTAFTRLVTVWFCHHVHLWIYGYYITISYGWICSDRTRSRCRRFVYRSHLPARFGFCYVCYLRLPAAPVGCFLPHIFRHLYALTFGSLVLPVRSAVRLFPVVRYRVTLLLFRFTVTAPHSPRISLPPPVRHTHCYGYLPTVRSTWTAGSDVHLPHFQFLLVGSYTYGLPWVVAHTFWFTWLVYAFHLPFTGLLLRLLHVYTVVALHTYGCYRHRLRCVCLHHHCGLFGSGYVPHGLLRCTTLRTLHTYHGYTHTTTHRSLPVT